MKRKLVKIGEASRLLGTSPAQLRKWDAVLRGREPGGDGAGGGCRRCGHRLLRVSIWPWPGAELERQRDVMAAYCRRWGGVLGRSVTPVATAWALDCGTCSR